VFAIVPPFRYQPPALATTLAEHWMNFAVLAFWLVAAILLALLGVKGMALERD
jgi:hypothetical protein